MANNKQAPNVYGAALQGARADQQDAFRTRWIDADQAWLLVVADGMGGHAAGGLASRIAVDSFVADFAACRQAGGHLDNAFNHALDDANTRICKIQNAEPELDGMGTTLASAYVSPLGVAWVSVGDLPIWLCRSGTLSRLNEDHSLRAIVEPQMRGAANMLRSALTGKEIPMIDCHAEPMPLVPGDLVLLGSDGVLTLSESVIAGILADNATKDPELITRALLQGVCQQSGPNQDNCTVIIASVPRGKLSIQWFREVFRRAH